MISKLTGFFSLIALALLFVLVDYGNAMAFSFDASNIVVKTFTENPVITSTSAAGVVTYIVRKIYVYANGDVEDVETTKTSKKQKGRD